MLNSKFETLNSKQAQMSKTLNSKLPFEYYILYLLALLSRGKVVSWLTFMTLAEERGHQFRSELLNRVKI
jgi:hypothetical protein